MQEEYNKYMSLALELAEKGRGRVSPNPLVGSVIVKGNRIIGKGFHERFGGAHAEINALKDARKNVYGATMFINLEPCCHYGKTPPCIDKIIASGLKEVIIGIKDPNPLVNGKAIRQLRRAGVKVKTGVLAEEAEKLNEIYIKFISKKLPFIILKSAMSIDGKIATRSGHSRWISNEASRKYVHDLRSQVDAVLVGINTVLRDKPELTVRGKIKSGTKNPTRIVVDSSLRVPLGAKVLNKKAPSIIATTNRASLAKIKKLENKNVKVLMIKSKNGRVDLKTLVKSLARLNISSILVEGGGNINAGMLEANLVDKVLFFISSIIIGGRDALTPVEGKGIDKVNKAIRVKNTSLSRYDDILIEGYIKR